MGAVGSVVGVIFGVIWTGAAASADAPPFFLAFGVLFIIVGIVQALYHYKNATGENRFSAFDITEDGEEPDPLDRRGRGAWGQEEPDGAYRFCPYCGEKLPEDFQWGWFCPYCGEMTES